MIRKIICALGAHDWNYSGYAYNFAPNVIRCHHCGKKIQVEGYIGNETRS